MSEYTSAQGKHLEIRRKLNEAGIHYDPERLDDVDPSVRRKLAEEWILRSNIDSANVLRALTKEDNLDYEKFLERVKRFHRKHGLREDGILGPNTLDIMNRETK